MWLQGAEANSAAGQGRAGEVRCPLDRSLPGGATEAVRGDKSVSEPQPVSGHASPPSPSPLSAPPPKLLSVCRAGRREGGVRVRKARHTTPPPNAHARVSLRPPL